MLSLFLLSRQLPAICCLVLPPNNPHIILAFLRLNGSWSKLTDVVSTAKRSKMMSGIGGKDTKPELLIRKGLHAKGFRFRVHDRKLPGKPDLVLPRYKAVILINGCFWHGHSCHLFKWPSTRSTFWKEKISQTILRDTVNCAALDKLGWRVLTIWECAVKGKTRLPIDEILEKTITWLISGASSSVLQGSENVAD